MKNLLLRNDVKDVFKMDSNNVATVKCMGMEVSYLDLEDTFSLDGFEVTVVNVLYKDCYIKVSIGNGNCINIVGFPSWLGRALYESRLQGQEVCIELLGKMTEENRMTYSEIKIPYDNTVS